jgi:hypothetical protein
MQQILQVNDQVDISANDLRTAAGITGSLTSRLAIALQTNGNLVTSAVDAADHSIEAHTDGSTYVRMLATERAKLALIASGATNVSLLFETSNVGNAVISNCDFGQSSTTSWRYTGGKLYLDTAFPGIGHHYNVVPTTSDYTVFTNPFGVYDANTLRVYINGIRLSPGVNTYIPRGFPTPTWSTYQYTETTPASGIFTLSSAIGVSDVIAIDFDYNF